MAEVGEDLLDGELDVSFGDLDGEEEDALLADDGEYAAEYASFQKSRQAAAYVDASQDEQSGSVLFHLVDEGDGGGEVTAVAEGDEAEEDVLELGVVDELEEAELDQSWSEKVSMTGESGVGAGVSSSTGPAADDDEEDDEGEGGGGRGGRFRAERTNVISLKGCGKAPADIPDSLDKVKTVVPVAGMRGGMCGRGGVRGRLGPIPQRGGFRPQQPHPHPYTQQRQQYAGGGSPHKIHVNPHFRGPAPPPPEGVWNERLPPPPGCDPPYPHPHSHPHPHPHPQDGSWPAPPPHMRPPLPVQHHPPPFYQQPQQPLPQHYPPPYQQGYEEVPYQPPPTMEPPSPSNRVVHFSENSSQITVEAHNYQPPPLMEPNYGPPHPNSHYPPPDNTPAPPQYNHGYYDRFEAPRPNFPPPQQQQHYQRFPVNDFLPPQVQPPPFNNYRPNWNTPPPRNADGGQYYPQPVYCDNTNSQPRPRLALPPPPQQQQPPFRQPLIQNRLRPGVKRLAPAQPASTLPHTSPTKQMRFEKPKPQLRSNLQEIKTVDSLPDTTVQEEEEDEETKQYRLKIAEQKALREKVLRQKEARRLAAIKDKQRQQQAEAPSAAPGPATAPASAPSPVTGMPRPQQPKPQAAANMGKTLVEIPAAAATRGGRRQNHRRGGRKQVQAHAQPQPNQPVVQVQEMLGTVYKIVKVRTKNGEVVTRKTPLLDPEELSLVQRTQVTQMTRTIPNISNLTANRRIVLGGQGPARVVQGGSEARGAQQRPGSGVRMAATRQAQAGGRTLFNVPTTGPQPPQLPRPKAAAAPQRVVIDNRPRPLSMAPAPSLPTVALPFSRVVRIDNLSTSTTGPQIIKMAKQVGTVTSFKHEPELKKATLNFQKPKEAEQFFRTFHRKMIDLSRIVITVVPE